MFIVFDVSIDGMETNLGMENVGNRVFLHGLLE